MSTVLGKNDTYLGLFIYIILPGFLLLGLIMIPIGIMVSRKRAVVLSPDEKKRLPSVDLNNPRHRKAFIGFTVATCNYFIPFHLWKFRGISSDGISGILRNPLS